jgi:hypothetical protein
MTEGRMKEKIKSLQVKLIKRLIQWGENYLSQGGKEVLIKATAQTILLYVIVIFKLPFWLLDEVTKLIRNFWWGAENGEENALDFMGQHDAAKGPKGVLGSRI